MPACHTSAIWAEYRPQNLIVGFSLRPELQYPGRIPQAKRAIIAEGQHTPAAFNKHSEDSNTTVRHHLAQRRAVGSVPQPSRAIHAPAEDALPVRVEGGTADRFAVPHRLTNG